VLAFAAVNPFFEEAYWRGALLDAGRRWPFWLIALYSTVLFVASHPLMWGVFSAGNRSIVLFATLFVMGIAWAYLRRATRSLRFSVLSHVLVDVGNLSVFVFLNLYVPPGM
jgi:membrane protease YdiL (CAAX protease family)